MSQLCSSCDKAEPFSLLSFIHQKCVSAQGQIPHNINPPEFFLGLFKEMDFLFLCITVLCFSSKSDSSKKQRLPMIFQGLELLLGWFREGLCGAATLFKYKFNAGIHKKKLFPSRGMQTATTPALSGGWVGLG